MLKCFLRNKKIDGLIDVAAVKISQMWHASDSSQRRDYDAAILFSAVTVAVVAWKRRVARLLPCFVINANE